MASFTESKEDTAPPEVLKKASRVDGSRPHVENTSSEAGSPPTRGKPCWVSSRWSLHG